MRKALKAKFSQNLDARTTLVKTGARKLIEKSPTDNFWGCGADGTGKNRLGELLMDLRAEIQLEQMKDDKPKNPLTYTELEQLLFPKGDSFFAVKPHPPSPEVRTPRLPAHPFWFAKDDPDNSSALEVVAPPPLAMEKVDE
jgi:hypothetical protein